MATMAGQIKPIGVGDDGLYRVRIRIESNKNGRRGTFSETLKAKTRQAAERLAKARLKALVQEKNVTVPSNAGSLNSLFDKYLREVVSKKVKRQTRDDYERVYGRYIRKTLGLMPVNKITREDVSALYDSLGLAPNTIRRINMILKAAYKEFIHRDYVSKNPCDVTLPKLVRREYAVLSPTQYQDIVRVSSPFWRTLIMFDIETGLRPEEFLALTWSNVTDRTVKVRKALVRFPKGEYVFTDPKNDASRRTIPISATLSAQLRMHRTALLELRMKQGAYWQDLDLVFPTEIGTPFTLSNLNRKFKALLQLARDAQEKREVEQSRLAEPTIPSLRPYDMRHTCATWLLEAGENIKVVSERLGHSSIAVTADTYLHVSEGMQQSATEKLEKLVEPLLNALNLRQDSEITQNETGLNNDVDPIKQGITGLRKTA